MSIWISQELLIISMLVLLLVPLYLYFKSSRSKKPAVLPRDWPIVGMLPSLVANLHNLYDYFIVVLAGSGHNFRATGPMGFFITCDPENVRHIFTTNYANFPKGAEFAMIFDIMDGSFFTIDGEACRRQRSKAQSVLGNPQLLARMASCCRDKLEKGLLPVFARMASTGTPFDVQDMITRFVFDLTATPLFGVDPGLLSADMQLPPMDRAVAMDTVMEVATFRHTVPASWWKLMRRLNIGPERKLAVAHAVLRGFVTEMMERRKKEQGQGADILSWYMDDPEYQDDEDLLRATLINYMIAGRDTLGTTLPWVFYNLAQNPDVVSNIRAELSPIASRKANNMAVVFETEETRSLVYLKAVLYETLRMYPPSPIERKTVVAHDLLPSGHEVHTGDTLYISLHSMGRMEDVWGKDCLLYNPDRWLSQSQNGQIKLRYVPSHKFLAFNSGPRMCLGKDIALTNMKCVVAAVVWNFDVEVLPGQTIEPKLSCIFQMKNGLTVKLKKRQT